MIARKHTASDLKSGEIKQSSARMAGWLDGWMAGWLDGWMAGWLDGWME